MYEKPHYKGFQGPKGEFGRLAASADSKSSCTLSSSRPPSWTSTTKLFEHHSSMQELKPERSPPVMTQQEKNANETATATPMPKAANAGLLVVGIAGAGLLVWWALDFHPSNKQLWMVPAGLVLMGTPVVVWFSVFASGACRRLEHQHRPDPES